MFAAGFLGFRDYGISWDENTQRNSGVVFFNHFQEKFNIHLVNISPTVPKLADYQDKEFGAIFEVFIFTLERLFGLSDYKNVFLFRHFINFIFFWFGVVIFSSAIRARFKQNYMPVIGCLILFLHPRIFAESFYNSKDIILMVFFIFSFRFFMLFNETWKIKDAFWFGLAGALTFNIRPVGILIPVITGVIMLPVAIRQLLDEKKWNRLISLFAFVFFFFVLVWITNLYLWDDPLHKPMQIINKFLRYDVSHTAGNILFLGNYLPTNDLPWYYLPLWIGITTPVIYLLYFVTGFAIVAVRSVLLRRYDLMDSSTRINLFILGWVVIPMGLAVVFGSTLYDGWRHFYFLWPAIVFLLLSGFEKTISLDTKKIQRRLASFIKFISLTIIIAGICGNCLYNYRWKAHQYCYFNVLTPEPATNFELDYWGLSYDDALEYLVNNDMSDTLRVQVLNLPGYLNSFLLDPRDRERIWYHHSLYDNFSTRIGSFYPFRSLPKFMKAGESAKYYISNFRDTSSPEELWKYRSGESPYVNQEYSLRIDGLEIVGIYKP